MVHTGKYTSIGIVCEYGMASSAMGAAVLRKVLNENGLEYIRVKAYATGLPEAGAELIICQKDYYNHAKGQLKGMEVCLVENLLHKEDYQTLLRQLARQEKI